MNAKRFLLTLSVILCGMCCWADSPLTSTPFHNAYTTPMTEMALDVKGEIPLTMLSYLADQKNPIAERLAIVNGLGWDFNGKTTGAQLGVYLMNRFNVKNEKKLAKKLDAGTLAVYAYAKAMSNYFDVKDAKALAAEAVKKDRTKSFSIRMVSALIQAQQYLDSDWSMVYQVVNDVMTDGKLNVDMRQEAIDIIWDYIKNYK